MFVSISHFDSGKSEDDSFDNTQMARMGWKAFCIWQEWISIFYSVGEYVVNVILVGMVYKRVLEGICFRASFGANWLQRVFALEMFLRKIPLNKHRF